MVYSSVFCALLPLLSVPSYLDCLCYLSSMPASTLCFQLIVQARVECPTLLFFPDFIAYLVVSFGGCPCWVTSPNLCFLWLSVLCTWILLPTLRCFLVSLCYIAYWCVLSPGYLVYLVFSCLPCVFLKLTVFSRFLLPTLCFMVVVRALWVLFGVQ